ncbi:DUF3139 domain-containing protein [Paenibacillus turicensis]|nr:DUF3139 domain-containing protein [Paenibacillus turicensis]
MNKFFDSILSKKSEWIILLFTCFLVVFIACLIYFTFNGTPWGRIQFKKQAEEYLKENYANEQVIDIEVGYSFISGNYNATFYIKSGKSIFISVRDDKQLQGFNND